MIDLLIDRWIDDPGDGECYRIISIDGSIIFTAIHPLGHATLEGDYKFNESLLGQSIVAIEGS